LPINNYAWSKLGGEAAVQMYKNSLILRVCMTEKPFVHKSAFANVKSNFIFHEDVAKILFKLINKKGIINVGGKTQTIYNFAKENNSGVKKIYLKNKSKTQFPKNPSINISKLKKLINF
jgi:dTDP-4-dehydrorhamnose reductase